MVFLKDFFEKKITDDKNMQNYPVRFNANSRKLCDIDIWSAAVAAARWQQTYIRPVVILNTTNDFK